MKDELRSVSRVHAIQLAAGFQRESSSARCRKQKTALTPLSKAMNSVTEVEVRAQWVGRRVVGRFQLQFYESFTDMA